MANDYGSDFSAVDDLDPSLTFLDSPAGKAQAMTEALARRFNTPRGGLFYDPTYGLALNQFVADLMPIAVAQQSISQEALKDERVASCECVITVQKDKSWKIQINPKDEAGAVYDLTFIADSTKAILLAPAGS